MKGTAMPERFALGTFSVAGSPAFAGVVVDDLVVAATALQAFCEELGRPLSQPETVFGLLQAWERNFPVLQACMAGLRRAATRAVLHIFDRGVHGRSLADETSDVEGQFINPPVQIWMDLALKWLKRQRTHAGAGHAEQDARATG